MKGKDTGTNTRKRNQRLWLTLFCLLLFLTGCQKAKEEPTTAEEPYVDQSAEAEGAMSWEEFERAETGDPIVIDVTIKEVQTADADKVSLMTEDTDKNAYWIEDMLCTEEERAQLTAGVTIRVTGYKAGTAQAWEITDAEFEILESQLVQSEKEQ